jgi:hypothetical protein
MHCLDVSLLIAVFSILSEAHRDGDVAVSCRHQSQIDCLKGRYLQHILEPNGPKVENR